MPLYDQDITQEKLTIRNFLSITNAEIEIKPITILIGRQASGKSIIAKLTYFFRTFLGETFVSSIRKRENKPNITKAAKENFKKIFPAYAWEKDHFSIAYQAGEYLIVVSNKGSLSSFTFEYSKNLQSLHLKTKNDFRKLTNIKQKKRRGDEQEDIFEYSFEEEMAFEETLKNNGVDKDPFSKGLFIPAGRSFFSFLQQNLFNFLRQSGIVDTLIADFGSFYERVKNVYHNKKVDPTNILLRRYKVKKADAKKLDQLTRSILIGEYVREENKDWIVNETRKVNVANASSGQQETLPLLLALRLWPLFSGNHGSNEKRGQLFIEEPEAHLFPESQKSIVELIATIHNLTYTRFFITTHSPYILTALNTLIYANNISNEENKGQVEKIIEKSSQINKNDVSAYSVEKNRAKPIFDIEYGLIEAETIDTISDEISKEFDMLLEL